MVAAHRRSASAWSFGQGALSRTISTVPRELKVKSLPRTNFSVHAYRSSTRFM